jgi:hypothetical protein
MSTRRNFFKELRKRIVASVGHRLDFVPPSASPIEECIEARQQYRGETRLNRPAFCTNCVLFDLLVKFS